MLPVSPAAPKTTLSDIGKPNADDMAGSRDDRRRQLAELIARLLARHWIDRVLVNPMPGESANHPP